MRNDIRTIFTIAIFLVADSASAQTALPNPVKTCEDVRAYIGADQSIAMDSFKSLLTAIGFNVGGALDAQCKANAFVKQHIMSQHLLTKPDGGEVRISGHLITDNGVCKLTEIVLAGCSSPN